MDPKHRIPREVKCVVEMRVLLDENHLVAGRQGFRGSTSEPDAGEGAADDEDVLG